MRRVTCCVSRRSLSSEARQGPKVRFGFEQSTWKDYRAKMTALRKQWMAEEDERRASSMQTETEDRERKREEKEARDAVKRQRYEEHLKKLKEDERLAGIAQRVRIERAVEFNEKLKREKMERQARLVEALKEESKYWLSTDELVDEKINDDLWEEPASTGLVTEHSHMFWRYTTSVERLKMYPPDLSALTPTPQALERQRVATATEMLIKTQTENMNEYHEAIEQGNTISDAIKDLPVEMHRPRSTFVYPTPDPDADEFYKPKPVDNTSNLHKGARARKLKKKQEVSKKNKRRSSKKK